MPLPNSTTTRLPGGVTNVGPTSIFANFPAPVPTNVFTYFDDFTSYVAGDWVVTESAAAATQALTAGSGGLLLLTNSATNDALLALQKTPAMILMSATQQTWFSARFKVSDATESDVVVGLQVIDITPLDVTDGIYLLKADGAATFDVVCRKNATTGSTSATAVASLVTDTFIVFQFYYDGAGKLFYGTNGTLLGALSVADYFPDTTTTVSFAIQNGEGVAKTMTVDWMYLAQERTASGA